MTPTLNCGTAGQYLVQISAFDGTDFLDRTRRAWVRGAPLTLDPAEAGVQVTALGTSFRRHGRVELDVTNGDGTTGTCEVTVKGFLAAFF